MAEGLMNKIQGDNYKAYSAGTTPSELNRFAIEAMKEMGIDISSHYTKNLDELKNIDFDLVVTVCDSANENCPVYLKGDHHIHKSFKDPTAFQGSDEEKLDYFKDTGNQIKEWIINSFD